MRKTDFLFVYEVKNRELENICLLKYELEKRGYSAELVETWEYVHKYHEPIEAKVTISFAMYNDDVFNYIASFTNRLEKVVNLQWEQIYTNSVEQEESIYTVKGIAKKAIHICWGNHTVQRLISMGVPERNVELTGHIALDFLRKELVGYYMNRHEICKKFNLPENKKIHLFVSSFSFIGMPDKTLKSDLYQNLSYNPMDFKQISAVSQQLILEWFRSVLENNESDIIIYRPHPAEVGNVELVRMAKEYGNFYVISSESVKQWVLVVDMIYTWYSTSVAEVITAGKDCIVLRPHAIPYPMEIPIFNDATFITTLSEFRRIFKGEKQYSSVSKEQLADYYYSDPHEASYVKVCNALEKVINSSDYSIEQNNQVVNMPKPFDERFLIYFKFLVKRALGNICATSLGKWLLSLYSKRLVDFGLDYNFARELATKNQATQNEIEMIQLRIAEALEKQLSEV
jgi:surface carbohydrate biosynthesis protein